MAHPPARRPRLVSFLAAAGAVALLSAGLVTAPAHAELFEYGDAIHDMVYIDENGDSSPSEETLLDIEDVVVRHSERAVTIKATFTALDQSRPHVLFYGSLISGQRGGITADSTRYYRWNVKWIEGEGISAQLINEQQNQVCTEGMRYRIDWEDDLIRVTIPRDCVRTPRWISVDLDSGVGSADGSGTHYDNGFTHAYHSSVNFMGPIFSG